MPGLGRGLLGQAPVPGVDFGFDLGELLEEVGDASVRTAVWSCMRPGRNAPAQKVRPCSSVTTVAFLVFIFLPDTKARRPGLPGGA